jgi:hypothetical protein
VYDILHPTGRRGSLHDQVFKILLGRFLPEFLTLVAPEPAGRLDLTRWKPLDKKTFTDWPHGKRRELDLLAEVALAAQGNRSALIHIEIEARFGPKLGARLADYYMQVRLRHRRPVLPIALCLRRGKPGVLLQAIVDSELGPEIGCFRYYTLCLERCRAEDYLSRDEPLAWALAALMRAETLSRAEHKLACLRRIAAARLGDLDRVLLVNCVETYLQLEGRDAAELDALLARSQDEEVRVMRARKLSWAEQIFTEGREEGEEIGVQKGVEQGFQQSLLLQLGLRFGPLSDDVKRRVEKIHSVDRLKEILEKVLVARSLEEMGLQ